MDDLWKLTQRGDVAARNRLVESYMPLVRYVAARMRVGLPQHVDLEDLVSYGYIGLIRAVDRFDAERGIRFPTFAVQWIRGAILDELRSQDWAPRRVRRDSRTIEQAIDRLSARLQREPTLEELAAELKASTDVVSLMLGEMAQSRPHQSLDSTVADEESRSLADLLPVPEEAGVRAEEGEHAERIAGAIRRLNEQERTIIALYYFEDCTFSRISELLGVTESRVFQIHSGAMTALRGLATA